MCCVCSDGLWYQSSALAVVPQTVFAFFNIFVNQKNTLVEPRELHNDMECRIHASKKKKLTAKPTI